MDLPVRSAAPDRAPAPPRHALLNPAGEVERDRRPARGNAVEALLFAAFVLLGAWPFCYQLGIRGHYLPIQDVTLALLKFGLFWALFISPVLWHGDSSESLGLGHPLKLFRRIVASRGAARWVPATVALTLFLSLLVIGLTHWRLTARFFKLPAAALLWPETAAGELRMLAFCIVIAGAFASGFIRYDNFAASLIAAAKLALPIAAVAVVLAFVCRGSEAFAVLASPREWLDIIAYVFWGGMQQTLFTGWFGTRLRKGLGPVKSRLGRFAIALLTASFFALIHLPSYRLVVVTLILGTMFAWLAMQDRFRNIAAFAVVHGVLGATVAKLFSSTAAGALHIKFRVGPWNAAGDPAVTWIAVACALFYLALAIVLARRQRLPRALLDSAL